MGANAEGAGVSQEVVRIRERLHKIADLVQAHEGKLLEHGIMLKAVDDDVKVLRLSTATGDALESATERLELKLQHLAETMEPIKKGVYWTVAIIVGTVIAAVLALIIRGGPLP